jgi:hypothetical protein
MGQAATLRDAHEYWGSPKIFPEGVADKYKLTPHANNFIQVTACSTSRLQEFDFEIHLPKEGGSETILAYMKGLLKSEGKSPLRLLLGIATSRQVRYDWFVHLMEWWTSLGVQVIGSYSEPKDAMDLSKAPKWVSALGDIKGIQHNISLSKWMTIFPWSGAKEAFLWAVNPSTPVEALELWFQNLITLDYASPPSRWLQDINICTATQVINP